MKNEATIVINLPLFGETYKIKSTPAKEEKLRKYAQIANKHFEEGKRTYPGLKDKDYVSIGIINLFGDLADDSVNVSGNEELPQLLDELYKMNQLLD
jgi:hypothetical protein